MVLKSSSKLLNFCVDDMLSLAQINSNTFRKNFSIFDVRESVSEVMQIQQDRATFNQITFRVEFKGFNGNFLIHTDE
jgi:signal transduction histidine kinase